MDVSLEELDLRMSRFHEVCKRSGIKLTHQRFEILREVARTDEHPDVLTIYKRVRERIPTLSHDTVYRTLWLLTDLGLVTTFGSSLDPVRFDANIKPHHHFVCVRCGMVRDFYSTEFDELKIPDGAHALGKVKNAHVELRGFCSRCSGSKKKGK